MLLRLRVVGPDPGTACEGDGDGDGDGDGVGGVDGSASPALSLALGGGGAATPLAEARKGLGAAHPRSAEGGRRPPRPPDPSHPHRATRSRAAGLLCQGPLGAELLPFASLACDAHRLALGALDHALADAASCHADMNAVTELKVAAPSPAQSPEPCDARSLTCTHPCLVPRSHPRLALVPPRPPALKWCCPSSPPSSCP